MHRQCGDGRHLRAAHTREKFLCPIGASVVHRIGFLMVDTLMAIATWRHSVGDNSSNFFSAASYTLTWSIGNSALRSLALFCAASSVGNIVFIRPSTSRPKPSVITRSARVTFRGCGSSAIFTYFSHHTPPLF